LPFVEKAKRYKKDQQLVPYAEYPQEIMTIEFENEAMRVKLLVKSIYMERNKPDVIQNLNGILFFKSKK